MSKREDKKLKQQNKKVSIGGQAVIEGVMMRGKSSMATAVRDEEGIIRLETKRLTPTEKKNVFLRLPFVRGIVSFITSMTNGTKVLMRSAEVFGEGEPSKLEKWVSEKLKINVMSVITTFSMILGLFLAVFLFMWLPQFVREQLEVLFSVKFDLWAKNFIEGGLKLLVFVSYILLASILKDIRRTFMYHGAEHKTISCYERGLELTVENAKKCTRVHDRCGTTFMVLVMVVSILVFAGVEALVGTSVENIYRVLLKIALLPVVAGISYEILKLLSKTKSVFFLPLKAPGLLLQCITTREPDDEMLEVAITAFKTVMEMDENPEIPEVEFIVPVKCNQLVEQVKEKLLEYGIDEGAEAEWIVSLTVGIKRDELVTENLVSAKNVEKINKIVEERITGRPLWYCIGDTEFYGYTIKVDERVLIPRPETEILVDKALECVNSDSKVLDLCTGSGAIAISINKQSGASVTAVDISDGALALASENSKLNNAEVTFVKSDMFANLTEEKFDVIVSNPPYIKRSDLTALQKEVADFEPTIALDGGDDGLDFYRVICKTVRNYLNNGGVLLMECGFNQAQDISAMLDGFTKVEIIKDYENIDRIVKAVL
jgi:release factor-specific protein-(glutamine-N5) methyltransferase